MSFCGIRKVYIKQKIGGKNDWRALFSDTAIKCCPLVDFFSWRYLLGSRYHKLFELITELTSTPCYTRSTILYILEIIMILNE